MKGNENRRYWNGKYKIFEFNQNWIGVISGGWEMDRELKDIVFRS
jgi:hypothetical protein